MICKNRKCKHIGVGDKCEIPRKVKISASGRCEAFEKGVMYYIDLVYDALSDTNMILPQCLTMDMRIGLYYVMTIFHLGFSESDAGPVLGRFFTLRQGKDGKALTAAEIVKLPLDMEALEKICLDFDKGILPGPDMEDDREPPKKKSQPFGWLSPTGEFTEGDWGEHEQAAFEIIQKKGLEDDWDKNHRQYYSARDYLSGAKGYALIHNPTGLGGYIVSHEKPLTKKQKDFLYGYFIDMGDSLMANKYMEEQE